jgi:hypothetical protein
MASSSHLKHGEKGAITAIISTIGKKGLTVETIEVVSNDPKRPKAALTLQTIIVDVVPLQAPESCR